MKIVCNENEELKVKLRDTLNQMQRLTDQNNQMNQQLKEFAALNDTMRMLKDKVGKLSSENTGLQDEVSNAQENLRLSAAQNQKIMMELNQYKDQLSHNDQ